MYSEMCRTCCHCIDGINNNCSILFIDFDLKPALATTALTMVSTIIKYLN